VSVAPSDGQSYTKSTGRRERVRKRSSTRNEYQKGRMSAEEVQNGTEGAEEDRKLKRKPTEG